MMGDGRAEVCRICGKAFLAGCVEGEPCPECSWEEFHLKANGWKKTEEGLGAQFGMGEEVWLDPKFPGTKLTRKEALALQESRDVEAHK